MLERLLAVLAALVAVGCASDEREQVDQEDAEGALSSDALRIMSYNIKYGEVSGLDLAKVAAAITPSHPDLLALQEVDEGTHRSGGRHETDDLSTLTGMPYRYFGVNFDYDGGKYGLSLLSKYPLVNPRVIRLDNLLTSPQPGHEARIAVAAEVNVRGTALTFVTAHASLHLDEHPQNAQAILSALGGARAIIVGDFNEKPGEKLGRALEGAGFVDAFKERHPSADGYTIPAGDPARRIDFIFRGAEFKGTVSAWVPDFQASDHRPVAATIAVR
jgi:endonuclease/exonuclease/phosphatase family metal-dependent hydrolase